ncbi:MAG: hypothetical protein AAGD92_14835 [Pseudomonadota bacterium]
MIWLIAHMWILLLTSFAVGLAVGLWIRSDARQKSETEEQVLGTLDVDAPTVKEN